MNLIRSDEALARLRRRARWVPPVTTIAASAIVPVIPFVLSLPILPPLGLLTLLGWRLLRPELWSAWVALPLGLADDLLAGAPIGSGPVVWTLCFLVADEVDRRLPVRDYRLEWLLGAALLAVALAGGAALAALASAGGSHVPDLWPQWIVSAACFPIVARVVARCDRWRLGR